jgi:hypothetical protein
MKKIEFCPCYESKMKGRKKCDENTDRKYNKKGIFYTS